MESDLGDWPAIPGETPIDPSGLRDRSITTRPELCRAEAMNIRKAYVKYLAAAPPSDLHLSTMPGSCASTRKCIATCGLGRVSRGKPT